MRPTHGNRLISHGQTGPFSPRVGQSGATNIEHASNCSQSNGRVLQHLRPPHVLKARYSNHHLLSLSLSFFPLPLSPAFLSSLLQFSDGSTSPFAEGMALIQPRERGQRIKQTNTKLPEAMLRGTHGSLFHLLNSLGGTEARSTILGLFCSLSSYRAAA